MTLALTLTYDEGGFKDPEGNPTAEKTVSSATTESVHSKRVIRTAKYSNKEFLSDLIAKGTLSGPSQAGRSSLSIPSMKTSRDSSHSTRPEPLFIWAAKSPGKAKPFP